MEAINFLSIATIAFLGSFGHCVGMCGGIVLAYTGAKVDPKWNRTHQATAHLLYSLGRITTYTVMGALFGYLGSVATFSGYTVAALFLFAGFVMILTGLSIMGKLKFLTIIEHSIMKSGWYQKSFRALMGNRTLFSFYLLGMINGLLPCGFVYFFAVTAASTMSPFWGAIVMLVFGLSTIPALFSLGFFTGLMQKGKLRKTMITIASIAVIIYGLFMVYDATKFILHPERSLLHCCD
ncbi:sulfite exporter TauE/SafE family protein [Hydrogenimonas cancrithermarum]|uniref:Membrane protein n=1 Tax=Hydrogenimonas cancrithermarum TaxID=2993563 RepID=A0ABN6WVR7_9BACT|nr:sulfite exporter TauE/SafE family protein [Hydrogenimonas cancrithermarum]BDY12377.1 membrane protein [Hydrogenimonas cancrithermarum]